MDFKIGPINLKGVAQGVGDLVFGNENSSTSEDRYIERLLDRISNGVLAEDRRAAVAELSSLVVENNSAQLAFGAMGFPVLMAVLKEERDDVEMVQAALETLLGALTPIGSAQELKNGVQPSLMNSDLLSREPESISFLLSLLSEDDFYIQYYTLQLLTSLSTNSPNRLQEVMLTIPRGITRLMDMLMDREVIRNEALLLLNHLTRGGETQEIQKILVFEGAFDKIFNIIREEGSSEGGVVVQDCLQLLNNLISKNVQNQILLRETLGFDSIAAMLKLRKGNAYSYTQQKTINLVAALDTVELLLMGSPETEPEKDAHRSSNQTALAQKKMLDILLILGVESKWAPVVVRCLALRCIGNLVIRHPQNLEELVNRVIGEGSHAEPALNSILRIIMQTNNTEEFLAAEYIFKCFCEKNPDGQAILASTIKQPTHSTGISFQESAETPFGSILLSGLTSSETDGDLERCCRAASVLSHILKDNMQCKECALQVELELPIPSLASSELLMHRMVKHLALTSSRNKDSGDTQKVITDDHCAQPIILRLLITWTADCPAAVDSFLASLAHLTYLLELASTPDANELVRGLAAILLGACVCFNTSSQSTRDAFAVVDAIIQKIGLTTYFLTFDMMQKNIFLISSASSPEHKPLTRSNTASVAKIEDDEKDMVHQKLDQPILSSIFSGYFINLLRRLETEARKSILEIFSYPRSKACVVPAELERREEEEDDTEYINRLKLFVEKQCCEMQELLGRNSALAEELTIKGGSQASVLKQNINEGHEKVQSASLHQYLQEAEQNIKNLMAEKTELEAELSMYRSVATKIESDLKSLSDAYNSLEQVNLHLDLEVKALRQGGAEPWPDLEMIRLASREEAQKECDAELNDLLVCLGQEQSKVEKLSARLAELGEDVDMLLEGIGDDTGPPGEACEEED